MDKKFNKPLISIIIPVYNGSNYVKEAIDSALAQTYDNVEILVVNDGSNDEGKTEEIARSYGDKIRYFRKENGGVSSALNLGIREMKGEYFSWLSHDDVYTATKIEKQIEILLKFNQPVVAISADRQIDANSKYLGKACNYAKLAKKGLIGWEEETIRIINKPIFCGCSLLIAKEIFDKVGFFDENLKFNQDFDMWLKISLCGYSWVYVNEIGTLSRVHANQVTQTRRDLFFKDSYALGERLIPILSQLSTKKYNFLYYYAMHCAKYNLKKNVENCLNFGKRNSLISAWKKFKIKSVCVYGKFRPVIRKLYLSIVKGVKTK